MGPAAALREAQLWLRHVTRAELVQYYRAVMKASEDEALAKVAYDSCVKLRVGGAPEDTPYAGPFFWAAFTTNGI